MNAIFAFLATNLIRDIPTPIFTNLFAIGRFCHHIRDEISTFLHLLSFLKDFPSYLADQKYCMLKDLGEHYPCAKSDEPTLINYEMAK